jgi:hypothetical protein
MSALQTKFAGNAARVLPEERIEKLVETFDAFETVRDAGVVSRIIAGEA